MNEETANLRPRYDSSYDDCTDDDEPAYPTLPIGAPSLDPAAARPNRSELAYAQTEMLPHPRLVRRTPTEPRTRFARASSPLERVSAPMFLTPRRTPLPPPLRGRAAPRPLRLVTQADDELDEAFFEDGETERFR